MRLHLYDVNSTLKDIREITGSVDPFEADAFLLYNDCRGTAQGLVKTVRELTSKPVYTIQHGRASTRDYDAPNKFPMVSDKYLCWGQADYERMVRLGYGEKTKIVGCPLLTRIKPKVQHAGKDVLFVPINVDHEEPENLLVYFELIKMQYAGAQDRLVSLMPNLHKEWGIGGRVNVPFHAITPFNLTTKALPHNDKNLYHRGVIHSNPKTPTHMDAVFDVLANVDCVVCLDESTTEIFAMACDIPVVCCDIYDFHTIGGQPYKGVERIRTKAATHCGIADLKDAVMDALYNPDALKEERAAQVEYELTASEPDPVGRILEEIGWKQAVAA